jgi:hypothetical protein
MVYDAQTSRTLRGVLRRSTGQGIDDIPLVVTSDFRLLEVAP